MANFSKSKVILLVAIATTTLFSSCNRPEPNYEGVLMTEYGRNGLASFKTVTGAQGILGPGSELYQVPMFEEKGDADKIVVTAKDGGTFTVDPTYTYQAIRGKGPEIILAYKHVGTGDDFFNNIEGRVLNKLVTDAFRNEAGNYTTDSLMNNRNAFERKVEALVTKAFEGKFFKLNTLTSGLVPPASMAKAIESRNNAIQKANEVRNQLETSKMLYEKAKIDAETNKVKSAGLTSEVLTAQYIEMLKGVQKVYITDGKTPIVLK